MSQKIILPWDNRKWSNVKSKLSESILSITAMDNLISSWSVIKPRLVIELFNLLPDTDRLQKDFVNRVLPCLQKLILAGPKTFKGWDSRILASSTNLTFNRVQAVTLIACMWFGLFNFKYLTFGDVKTDSMCDPTMSNIWKSQKLFPLQCLLCYFSKVEEYINSADENLSALFSAGTIVIKRNVLTSIPDWRNSTKQIPPAEVCVIENNSNLPVTKMRTVSAHEFIGGEMFDGSITSEETILLIYPETLLTTLFCTKLGHADTVTVIGAEQISIHAGYGSSVRWVEPANDQTPYGYTTDETEVMLQHAIVFMDASSNTSMKSQIIEDFGRDLLKCYCGMSSLIFSKTTDVLATNWSYGFNGSNIEVKFIQQVLAAAQSNKRLIYITTRDLETQFTQFADFLADYTVGEVYNMYLEMCREYTSNKKLRLNDLSPFAYITSL
jgi:hypothetical protein